MRVEDLVSIRQGAELSNYEPYIKDDLDKMKTAVVNNVMLLMEKNDFTAEVALAKWYEYISIVRLGQRVNKKIIVGRSLGVKLEEK